MTAEGPRSWGSHLCITAVPPPLGVTFPAEGLEGPPAKHTNAFPTASAGWKLLPLASCLRFPPSTATPDASDTAH